MKTTTPARELLLIKKVWKNMKDRCFNPNSQQWKNYGGRGITVSSEWLSFEVFYSDMGPRFPGASLERKDNESNYCKENCKWATALEQARNTRRSLRGPTEKPRIIAKTPQVRQPLPLTNYRISEEELRALVPACCQERLTYYIKRVRPGALRGS